LLTIFKNTFKSSFLIAEAGINHNGNIATAFKLVDAAKSSGADAIKFQTYITEKRTKKTSPIFKILKKCELKFDDFVKLKKYCEEKKIFFFSTAFDNESLDFLKKINVKLLKVASFDISNNNLIKHILKLKIPTLISTGMASNKEITTINEKFKSKNIPHCLMHCISSYPNQENSSYLSNIEGLKNKFSCKIGFSDHTNNIKTSIYAYLLGARIIEKHFYLGYGHNCADRSVSIDPKKMIKLKNELVLIDKIKGTTTYGTKKVEKKFRIYKRIS
jgi:N,N'-diacetyllegionaminate synthase